jgi:hypothetical protein
MVVMIQVEVFSVVMSCSVHYENGGSKVLQNTGVLLQHYTASQPREVEELMSSEMSVPTA